MPQIYKEYLAVLRAVSRDVSGPVCSGWTGAQVVRHLVVPHANARITDVIPHITIAAYIYFRRVYLWGIKGAFIRLDIL